MEKLGNKIYNLRKSKGLSQEELAEALDVSRQSVSKWETDQSVPDSDNITAMCAFFNVSLDGFMGNSPEQPSADEVRAGQSVREAAADNRRVWKKIVLWAFIWFFAAVGVMTFLSFFIVAISVGGGDPQFVTTVIPILCVSYVALFAVVFTVVAVFYKKFKKPRV